MENLPTEGDASSAEGEKARGRETDRQRSREKRTEKIPIKQKHKQNGKIKTNKIIFKQKYTK